MSEENIKPEYTSLDLKRANVIINTFTKKVEETAPVRFGSSRDEKNSALKIREFYHKTLGLPSRMEPFTVRPLAGRFGIPVLGVVYAVALLFFILGEVIPHPVHNMFLAFAMFSTLCAAVLFVVQVYMNKNTFNFLYPKQTSYNVATAIDAEDEAEYTLVLGSHYDSDMDRADAFLFLRDKNLPKWLSLAIKIIVLLSVPTLFVCSMVSMFMPSGSTGARAFLFLFPVIFCGISIFYFVTYFSYKRGNSRKGRSNLTAAGISLAVADYLRQHPECVPENCKIVVATFGSQFCGAKGSEQFVLQHAGNDPEVIKPAIIDFRDVTGGGTKVIFGEHQQKINFDRNLSNEVYNSLKEDGQSPVFENNRSMFTDASPFAVRKIPSTAFILNADLSADEPSFDETFTAAANATIRVLGYLKEEHEKAVLKEKTENAI